MHTLMSFACYQLEGNKILLCTKIILLSDDVLHNWDERNNIYAMMDHWENINGLVYEIKIFFPRSCEPLLSGE